MIIHPQVEIVDLDPLRCANLSQILDHNAFARRTPEGERLLSILHDNREVIAVDAPPDVEAHVPERLIAPPLAARQLYESTANIDRVQIFEVHALAAFSRAVERLNWRALPILEFYSALWTQADTDPHGLSYFPPKPAAWNHLEVGQMHAWLRSIPDGMTLVLGIFEQGQVWASLILRVVAGSIRLITTFDTLERTGLDVQQMPTSPLDLEVICASVSEHIGHVAYGLVIERAAFFEWLHSADKPSILNKSLMNGNARLYKGL